MHALLLLSCLPWGLSRAADVDAWKPGGGAGGLDDPLSGHSGVVLAPGQGTAAAWGQVAQEPLDARGTASGEAAWQAALGLYGSGGVAGGWRPSAWTRPASAGARLRARIGATETLPALGPQSSGAALDDAAVWLRRGIPSPAHLQQVVYAEALVDFDGLGAAADPLRQLSGSGTGLAAGWAARLGRPGGALATNLSVAGSADLRSPAVAPQAARETVEVRAGGAWAGSGLACLVEVHARASRHGTGNADSWLSASVEPRVGLRGQGGPQVQWLALVGAGIPFRDGTGAWVQPTGSPDVRGGVELRWVPKNRALAPGPARSVGPGSLVVSPRSLRGAPLAAQVLHADAWTQPDGSVVLPYRPGDPVTVTADGHASLTVPPLVSGEGPWSWRPVLPERTGAARVAFRVLDEQEQAVALSTLEVAGGSVGPPVPGARVVLEGLGTGPVDVEAAGLLVRRGEETVHASKSDATQTVHLARPVGATRVAVVGDGSVLVGARVLVTSAVGFSELQTDRNGLVETRLAAGRWTVRVEADGFAAQEQAVEIGPKRGRLHDVVFALLPSQDGSGRDLEVTLIDPTGVPVEGGEVHLGGQRLGRTASGGSLLLETVSNSESALTVEADRFEPYTGALQAREGDGPQRVLVPLRWRPGQVEVEALAADGTPIRDAVVVVSGPEGAAGSPVALGPDGLARMEVPLGNHVVVVTAPGHTRVSLPVSVDPERETLIRVQATLAPETQTPAALRVQLSSTEMPEVEGAEIRVDGTTAAHSSASGLALFEGLSPGEHELEIRSPLHKPWHGTVQLAVGAERTVAVALAPRTGLLEVSASHAGTPVPALVRLLGPEARRPVSLGADGLHVFALPPASWEVLLSSEEFGLASFDVVVRADRDAAVTWVPAGATAPTTTERLPRVPVEVLVTERGSGAPVSATVRMLGPEVRPPAQTDGDGRLHLSLLPGFWEVLASSPRLGVGGSDVEVHREDGAAEAHVKLGSARVAVESKQLRLSEEVRFEVGSARIAPASGALLAELARTLILSPTLRRVRVEGHTDATGNQDANQRLSEARAASVVAWLVEAGVTPDRLEAQGYGESQPVASNDDDGGRGQNRRVVIRIAERAAVGSGLDQ